MRLEGAEEDIAVGILGNTVPAVIGPEPFRSRAEALLIPGEGRKRRWEHHGVESAALNGGGR